MDNSNFEIKNNQSFTVTNFELGASSSLIITDDAHLNITGSNSYIKNNAILQLHNNSVVLMKEMNASENSRVHLFGNSQLVLVGNLILPADTIFEAHNQSTLRIGNCTIPEGVKMTFKDDSRLRIQDHTFARFEGSVELPIQITFESNDYNFFVPIYNNVNHVFLYCNITNATLFSERVPNDEGEPISGTVLFSKVNFNKDNTHTLPLIKFQWDDRADTYINFDNCLFDTQSSNVIEIHDASFVSITNSEFNSINLSSCINIANTDKVDILNNTFSNYEIAIALTNVDEVLVQANIISDANSGIYLSSVAEPVIIENILETNNVSANAGIISVSSDGIYRLNTVTGFVNGIDLGYSSPKLAQNNIYNNSQHGLYIGSGSSPDLSPSYSENEGEYSRFPLSGFNNIYNNGQICGEESQSEITLPREDEAYVYLDEGCNNIYDDRVTSLCDSRYLMEGICYEQIKATNNYWGNHPTYGNDPIDRFGGILDVYVDNFLNEPCYYQPTEEFIVLSNSSGLPLDTIYSAGVVSNQLNEIDALYAEFNKHVFNKNYSSAKNTLSSLMSKPISIKTLPAYNYLFNLEKVYLKNPDAYGSLTNIYENRIAQTGDSIIINVLSNLRDLCLIENKNYSDALNRVH